jgi:DNA polymerase I-like protein with 3'-5' exonuclease and polymerase domains
MLVSFDTETYLANEGHDAPKIVCGSFMVQGSTPTILPRTYTLDTIRELLRDKSYTICGANIAYDFFACAADDLTLLPLIFRAYDEGRVIDVLLGSVLHLIGVGCLRDDGLYDPRTNKKFLKPDGKIASRMSLATTTDLLTGRKDAKANDYWRLRYAILERVPMTQWPEEAIQYCKDDAKNTLDCAVALQSGAYLNQHNQGAQAKAAWAMFLASQWGLRTDANKIKQIEIEEQAKLAEAIAPYIESKWCNREGNTNTKAIQAAVSKAYNDKPPTTAKGGVATDRDTLRESGDERLEDFAKLSGYKKILGTYIGALTEGTRKPIVSRENVLLASGRASYAGVVQLLPRDGAVRECFVARHGTVFCSVDYSALELATLAQCMFRLLGHNAMERAINAKQDLHSVFAASMMGVSYQEFTRRLEAKDPIAKAYRQAAKPCNFGFPGGMGVTTFVIANRKVGVRFCKVLDDRVCGVEKVTEWEGKAINPTCKKCLELAHDLREAWFKAWPEIQDYFDFVKRRLSTDRKIEQFVSKRIRAGLSFNAASNTLFQGLAADGAKHALYNLSKACYLDTTNPLFNSRPVLFIHDEIICEIPEENQHDAAFEQARIMVASMRQFVPDVLIQAKPALMRRWYKAAEDVYDNEGRLVAWEPKK